jgi:hypothetical protein
VTGSGASVATNVSGDGGSVTQDAESLRSRAESKDAGVRPEAELEGAVGSEGQAVMRGDASAAVDGQVPDVQGEAQGKASAIAGEGESMRGSAEAQIKADSGVAGVESQAAEVQGAKARAEGQVNEAQATNDKVQSVAADPTGSAEAEVSSMGKARVDAAVSGSAVGTAKGKFDEASGKAHNVEGMVDDPTGAAEAEARSRVESSANTTVHAEANVKVETEPKK